MVDIAKETNDKLSKASNSNSKEETLIELAFDNSPYVREKVASNINCTDIVFDILIKDEDDDVLLAVALNPKSSARYLDYLYKRNNKKINVQFYQIQNCLKEEMFQEEYNTPFNLHFNIFYGIIFSA